jgi:ATP-dependent Lon protease
MAIKMKFNNSESKSSKSSKEKKNTLKKNRPDSDSDSEDCESEDCESEDYETITEEDTDTDDDDDSSYRPPTRRGKNAKSDKKGKKKGKRVVESDSDDDESSEEDDDENEEDEEMDNHELQKFLSKIFPSKYIDEKVEKSGKKKSDKKKTEKADKKKSNKKKAEKKRAKKAKVDDSSSEESDSADESYDPEDKGFENAAEEQHAYNIIFGLDEEPDDDCAYNEEEEDFECNSEDEQTFMKESYQKVEPVSSSSEEEKKVKSEKKKSKKIVDKKVTEDLDEAEPTDVEHEYLELVETKKQLIEQLRKKPKSKVLRNAVSECNRSIKKLVKKSRTKNAKTYHKLVHDDKKRTNEIDYFKKKLSNKEQLRVMKDLKEINKHVNIEKPYRLTLLDSKMPAKFKAIALQKLNVLRTMEPGDNEYYKIKNWIDTFMRVPFGVYKSLSVKMDDGLDKCNAFMENAKQTLDVCTHGLNDAKMQIMQFMGQWIANPGAMGSAIAIHGPMGTGKTSLVKEGISKILGREFTFIALGGAGDSSFLEGHSYTYEGSSWGRIVQILIDSKCMNPVIYFDELDKVSDTPRGEEIIGILTHLTDTSQNSQFHDKYFSEIDFDLSKCLFIFSYNDESKVSSILRDRMYRIQTKGYESKEKVVIARDYLLPKIREQVSFKEGEVIIPDDTIQYIVGNSALTKEESGVRNLKRCLEIIHTKLNLFRLVKPDSELFGKDMEMKVTFPYTVTRKDVDALIKNEEKQNQSLLAMYI